MRSALLAVGSVAIALGAGCLADRTLPPSTNIPCASQEDCPATFTCRQRLGRCVAAGTDAEPPGLASVEAPEPAAGTLGTRFVVSFTVSEPLLAAPTVTADIGGGRELLPVAEVGEVGEAGTDGLRGPPAGLFEST